MLLALGGLAGLFAGGLLAFGGRLGAGLALDLAFGCLLDLDALLGLERSCRLCLCGFELSGKARCGNGYEHVLQDRRAP